MKRFVPFGIVSLIVGTFVWTLLFLYKKSEADPVVFKTEAAFTTDIVQKTVATGAIVPRREVALKPRVSGILEKLYVEPGKKVKAGDLIARIKIVPNAVNLSSAQSAVESARINFQNAQREYQRAKKLYGQQLVPEADLTRAQYEFSLRKQELSAARENLQLIRSGASKGGKVSSNMVTSTVDGMIIDVPEKEGASVTETNNFNPGSTIAEVADMTDMIFKGRVDESEVGKIKEGMALDIVIGAIDGKRFKGTLEYIAPKGVEEEGAIQFEIRAAIQPEQDVFIRANYSANANIVLDERKQVLAIKESLLSFDKDGKAYVEVEAGPQKFKRRDVEIGLSDGLNIEIVKGLSKGDKIKKAPTKAGEKPRKRRGR